MRVVVALPDFPSACPDLQAENASARGPDAEKTSDAVFRDWAEVADAIGLIVEAAKRVKSIARGSESSANLGLADTCLS